MKATTVEHQKKLYESKHRITSIFDFISKYGMIWSVFILLLPLMMTRGKFVKTQPTLPKITASLGRTRFSLKWVISWLGVILQTRGHRLSYRGLIKPSTSLSETRKQQDINWGNNYVSSRSEWQFGPIRKQGNTWVTTCLLPTQAKMENIGFSEVQSDEKISNEE